MIELGKRINQSELLLNERILGSEKLGRKMIHEIGHKKQEHLVALYLNTQNQIISQKRFLLGVLIVVLQNHVKFCITQ